MGAKTNYIYWPVQGDYYASITIYFNNGTAPKSYSYPDQKVHVASSDLLIQEREGRINIVLSYALVFFGFAEMFKIISEIDNRNNQGAGTSTPSGSSNTPAPSNPIPAGHNKGKNKG